MENVIFVLILISAVGLVAIGIGFSLRCPKCKKWWCLKNDGSKVTSENTKYETVTRNDIHKDRKGKEIGRTTRKEQIRVTYTHFLNFHFCKKCGHKWTTTSCKRREM